MTAEIAICNKNGIALAADSAVSTYGGQKIYNTANKLFMLSKQQPVAIMIYNSSALIDVPWEIIIKEFRKEIVGKEFDELTDYCTQFWQFIADNMSWFSDKSIAEGIKFRVHNVLMEFRESFITNAEEREINTEDKEAIKEVANSLLRINLKSLEEADFLEGFDEKDLTEANTNYRGFYEEVAPTVLEIVYELLDTESRNLLFRLCSLSLTKSKFENISGIVIAGYGKKDIFPKISSHQVGIFVNGKLRKQYQENKSNIHEPEFEPEIVPFAQEDVVRSFIQGVDPALNVYISTIIRHLPKNIADSM